MFLDCSLLSVKIEFDFYVLIFYIETLLKLWVLIAVSFVLAIYKIKQKQSFLSFQYRWTFILFSWSTAPARTFIIKLSGRESRHFCLHPDLRKKTLSLLPSSMMLPMGFFTSGLYQVKGPLRFLVCCLFISWRVVRFLSCFFICSDDSMVSVVYSMDIVYYINWSSDVKPTLHSWHKSHLVMVCNLLYVSRLWFVSLYSITVQLKWVRINDVILEQPMIESDCQTSKTKPRFNLKKSSVHTCKRVHMNTHTF